MPALGMPRMDDESFHPALNNGETAPVHGWNCRVGCMNQRVLPGLRPGSDTPECMGQLFPFSHVFSRDPNPVSNTAGPFPPLPECPIFFYAARHHRVVCPTMKPLNTMNTMDLPPPAGSVLHPSTRKTGHPGSGSAITACTRSLFSCSRR